MPEQQDLLLEEVEETEETPQEQETQETPEPQEQIPEPPQEKTEATPPAPPQEQQKMVPLQALQEARHENRRITQNVDALRQQFEQYRSQQIQQQQVQQVQQQIEVPKFEEDAIGHIRARIEKQDAYIEQLAKASQESTMQENYNNQVKSVSASIANDVQQFHKEQPDYDDAISYLSEKRMLELEAVGVTNPMQMQQHLNRSAWQLSLTAMQNGINPAKAAYDLAVKYGYQQKNAQQQNVAPQASLNTVSQGMQQASKNLQGGDAVAADPSLQELLNSQGDEFDKMWNKIFAKQIKQTGI